MLKTGVTLFGHMLPRVVLIALCWSFSLASGSSVLYTNFPYSTGAVCCIRGAALGYVAEATSFVVPQPATLAGIDLPLFFDFPSLVTVSLAADDAGLPGTLIESFDLPAQSPSYVLLFSFVSLLHPLLHAGTTYWVEIAPTQGPGSVDGTEAEWPIATSFSPTMPYFNTGSGWATFPSGSFGAPALQIDGDVSSSAIPEPSAINLAGAGMLVLFGLYRGNKLRRSAPSCTQDSGRRR
jgi:hypothetical protein